MDEKEGGGWGERERKGNDLRGRARAAATFPDCFQSKTALACAQAHRITLSCTARKLPLPGSQALPLSWSWSMEVWRRTCASHRCGCRLPPIPRQLEHASTPAGFVQSQHGRRWLLSSRRPAGARTSHDRAACTCAWWLQRWFPCRVHQQQQQQCPLKSFQIQFHSPFPWTLVLLPAAFLQADPFRCHLLQATQTPQQPASLPFYPASAAF